MINIKSMLATKEFPYPQYVPLYAQFSIHDVSYSFYTTDPGEDIDEHCLSAIQCA